MCYKRQAVSVGELYKLQVSGMQGPPNVEQDLKQIYTFSQEIMLKAACQAHDSLLTSSHGAACTDLLSLIQSRIST